MSSPWLHPLLTLWDKVMYTFQFIVSNSCGFFSSQFPPSIAHSENFNCHAIVILSFLDFPVAVGATCFRFTRYMLFTVLQHILSTRAQRSISQEFSQPRYRAPLSTSSTASIEHTTATTTTRDLSPPNSDSNSTIALSQPSQVSTLCCSMRMRFTVAMAGVSTGSKRSQWLGWLP